MRLSKKKATLGSVGLVALALSGCSSVSIDASTMAVHYSGSVKDGEHFENCVKPGSKQVDASGHNYRYPVNQRKWVNDDHATDSQNASGGADAGAVHYTSKDSQEMVVTAKTFFQLNTSCTPVTINRVKYKGGTIQVFHDLIGKPRDAYFNADGTYPTGWEEVLGDSVGSAFKQAVARVGSEYDSDIWRTQGKWPEFAGKVQALMPKLVNDSTETKLDFFKNFQVNVVDISPPAETRKLLQQRANAKLKADTVDANLQNQIAAAKAQVKIEKANADVIKAKINAYGSGDAYNKARMVDKGLNPYQPTYVVGGTPGQ